MTVKDSRVVEAAADPSFFGSYAPDLPEFTGAAR
jgi:hypothetical protein